MIFKFEKIPGLRGELHIDFRTHWVIMAQRTWPLLSPVPFYLYHFQIFDKIDSFPKKCFIAFMIKKGELHVFEELSNLYLIVLLIVTFLFFRVLLQKIEPSWKNYWLELQNQAKRKITNIQTAPDYSSATAIMLVIFWTERDFCIVSDCRNKFSNKVKNL